MDAMYERTENGTTETITVKDALAEVNHCMMGGRRSVKTMSSSHGHHRIQYKDGRDVRLVQVAVKAPAAPEQRTARIGITSTGAILGKVVTVKGKDYVTAAITPADRPIHKGAPAGWVPTAYVTYWSVRNGERFGATRTASATAKPGSVAHGVWHGALDHANGTR